MGNKGRTGIIKYIGPTEFSKGEDIIGLELDTYDAGGSEKHQKYFNAPKGRGYFTRKQSIANIVLPKDFNQSKNENNNNNNNIEMDKTTKRLISRTRKKLREIEVLEFKHKSGVVLHPNQIAKMNRKEELTQKLQSLKDGTFITQQPKQQISEKEKALSIREKVRIMARSTSID